ncbi:MAG: polyisoprenoid-binding protein [Alphaproteobacteria bacterium]|nr:MAG: polyisoprenoid-binding protein [Alphaproteobacteria bacterium]
MNIAESNVAKQGERRAMVRLLAAIMLGMMTIGSVGSARAAPVRYVFDPAHSFLGIAWQHFGFSTSYGKFAKFDGELLLDEKKPEDSKLTVTVAIDSLQVSTEGFRKHLLGADFFDAKKYPTATFVSRKITLTSDQSAEVQGDLTIHGVTKPATLAVRLNKLAVHPMRKVKAAGFDARAMVKRSQFGMGAFTPMVSDDVGIFISTELYRADSGPEQR